jgi:hypothetical protein
MALNLVHTAVSNADSMLNLGGSETAVLEYPGVHGRTLIHMYSCVHSCSLLW